MDFMIGWVICLQKMPLSTVFQVFQLYGSS